MHASRTIRTLQNSGTSLILFLIQIFVGFYSRKIFLNTLGDEILGLNTTLGNILSFLNLAELGIGIAMATSLYKPLHDNDKQTICEIIAVQGYLYKKIAILLCFLSIPILAFMPMFFPNTEGGLTYVYVAYIVFLWGSISGYFWNYRQTLIGADQKNFKLMPWLHGLRYFKIFAQIFFLTIIPLGIWGWISLEFLASIATIFIINHIINKEYPWLQLTIVNVKDLLKKYHYLLTKTKQLFVHKIGSFVLEQTAPLIIYYFVSLTMVTYYSNYMILIGYAVTLLNVVFEGMGASIGSLVSEQNKAHTLNVFWELFTSRLWVSGIASFAIYVCIGPFISLWIGPKYLLPETTLLMLIIGMFIRMTRSVIDSFKNAYQLFGDVWAPVVEATINLGGSIILGYYYGLNGIIMGSNLSLIIIVLVWKPYYTFKYGLQASYGYYYLQYLLHISIIILGAISTQWLLSPWKATGNSFFKIAFFSFTAILVYSILTYVIFFFTTKGMQHFTQRVLNIIHINK